MSQEFKWFQRLYYDESLQAVKNSHDFVFFENFKNTLPLSLPQLSENSKERITNNILNRFFPDKKLDIFMSKIWQIYNDEELLKEIFRYEFLSTEPVIQDFYLSNIYPKQNKEVLEVQDVSDFIIEKYGKPEKNLEWWLQSAIRDLGFMTKLKDWWKIKEVKVPERAFVLLLYKVFDKNIISIKEIEKNNFWKLLGIKDFCQVETILTKASLLNLLEYDREKVILIKSLNELLETKFKILN